MSTHSLRHSDTRHMLMNGLPISHLSHFLEHSSPYSMPIYLELVPDPTGSVAAVP